MKIAKALATALAIGAGYLIAVADLIALGATPTATFSETLTTALVIAGLSAVALVVREVRK